MKNGHGVERYVASGNGMSGGDIYDGQWKDNLKHGHGKHSYATGGKKILVVHYFFFIF